MLFSVDYGLGSQPCKLFPTFVNGECYFMYKLMTTICIGWIDHHTSTSIHRFSGNFSIYIVIRSLFLFFIFFLVLFQDSGQVWTAHKCWSLLNQKLKHMLSLIQGQKGRIFEIRTIPRNSHYMVALAMHHQSVDWKHL